MGLKKGSAASGGSGGKSIHYETITTTSKISTLTFPNYAAWASGKTIEKVIAIFKGVSTQIAYYDSYLITAVTILNDAVSYCKCTNGSTESYVKLLPETSGLSFSNGVFTVSNTAHYFPNGVWELYAVGE